MKRQITLLIVLCAVIFLAGAGYAYIKAEPTLYSEYDVSDFSANLVDCAVQNLNLDVEQWEVSTLDNLSDTLKDSCDGEYYQYISEAIYAEYYNESLKRGMTTVFLLSKNLESILIISDVENNQVLISKWNITRFEKAPIWDRVFIDLTN